MKDIRLDGAFSPVPDIVHQRLEAALKEKKEMNMNHLKRPTALVLALILIGLAGLAYAAAQTGILDYLVGGEKNASPALIGIVQNVENSVTEDNIKIDLTGAVYDGDRLSVSFDMTNLMPENLAQVTLDEVTLNGDHVYIDFSSANEQWLPSVFNVDIPETSRNPVHGGMLSVPIEQTYSGVLKGEAVFIVQRPANGKIAVLDPMMWYDYSAAIEDADMRTDYTTRRELVRNSGVTVGSIFDLNEFFDVSHWLSEGYTLLDIDGGFLLERAAYREYAPETFGDIAGNHQLTDRASQMTETARIVLPFTIDVTAALQKRVALSPEDVELPDGTVHFDQALLTPLSTLINMTLTPKDSSLESAQALALRYAPSYEMTDENGAAIEFLNMEGYAESYCDEDGAGGYVVKINYVYGGILKMPKEIHFPLAEDLSDTSEESQAARKAFGEKVFITVP